MYHSSCLSVVAAKLDMGLMGGCCWVGNVLVLVLSVIPILVLPEVGHGAGKIVQLHEGCLLTAVA